MGKRYAVMNPAYGYINAEDEYVGFDLQQAALLSGRDIEKLFARPSIEQEDIAILPFTEDQLKNELPFDLEEYPMGDDELPFDLAEYPEFEIKTEKFALLNPSYGYLNKDAEYKSFDLEDAAIYTQEDLDRFDLNGDEFIRQPFTDKQLADVPFKEGIPDVLEEPFAYSSKSSEASETIDTVAHDFDFADFAKGLDELDSDIVDEHTQ